VAKATPLTPTPDGALLVGTVIPSTGPQDQATTTLYNALDSTTLPHALQGTGDQGYVTGLQAAQTQFDQIVTGRLPAIIAVVIAVAFLLIMTAFRSLPLAVQAAVLNLFSIGAAYGVVVAVFQFGWGRSLLGISQNVPVEAYVPTSHSRLASSVPGSAAVFENASIGSSAVEHAASSPACSPHSQTRRGRPRRKADRSRALQHLYGRARLCGW
jgi:uncharacterized membrane protein YdfJ with MMPL/SSD domain